MSAAIRFVALHDRSAIHAPGRDSRGIARSVSPLMLFAAYKNGLSGAVRSESRGAVTSVMAR